MPKETVKTVKGYSIPGEGASVLISVFTVIGLFALWWTATHMGWIRDLFLPTPEKIAGAFDELLRKIQLEAVGNSPRRRRHDDQISRQK